MHKIDPFYLISFFLRLRSPSFRTKEETQKWPQINRRDIHHFYLQLHFYFLILSLSLFLSLSLSHTHTHALALARSLSQWLRVYVCCDWGLSLSLFYRIHESQLRLKTYLAMAPSHWLEWHAVLRPFYLRLRMAPIWCNHCSDAQ